MNTLNYFICAGKDRGTLTQPVAAPWLRREFELEMMVQQAQLTISGLGFYRVYVNGTDITGKLLAPYISNTDDCVYFDRYDLAPYLQVGTNVLGIWLGNGMQNAMGAYTWDLDRAHFQSEPKTCFLLELAWADGSKQEIVSDGQVMTHPSPIWFNDLWCGEYYDARREIRDWCSAGTDMADWTAALPTEMPLGEQRICQAVPIGITEQLAPENILPCEDGYLYDFGRVDAGICLLQIRDSRPGQEITLTHGEYFANGRLNNKTILFVPEEIGQVDRYICEGRSLESWSPRFTYHGFRYVLVRGITADQAVPELLTYQVAHALLAERGEFTCSDPVLDQLQEMTRRSTLGNFYFFPTDCPQREKHGWLDAGMAGEETMLNFQPEDSYEEWLVNIRKAQDPSGMLPGIVPTGGWGMGLGGPYWDGALINLPYLIWKYRGEKRCMADNAEAILLYLRFLESQRDEQGLLHFGIGDWCPVGQEARGFKSPIAVTDTSLAYDLCRKSEQMFSVLGKRDEAEYAARLAGKLYQSAREHLVDWTTYTVSGNCQTSQACFLYYGLFRPEEQKEAIKPLLQAVERADGFMDVGSNGGRILFHVLSEYGYGDLAFHMITRPEFPSYGNWITRGASTLWEDFHEKEEEVCSRNHAMWGDISNWMFQWVAGIQVNPTGKDVNEVMIRPGFIGGMQSASAWHDLPAGRVSVEWEVINEDKRLRIYIPEGVKGSLCLGRRGKCQITFEDLVKQCKEKEGSVVLRTEEGTFLIESCQFTPCSRK